jgi:hypothetical protein
VKRLGIGLGLVVFFCLSSNAWSQTVTACVNRGGAIKIPPGGACPRKWTPIILQLGADVDVKPHQVVDVNDNVLGQFYPGDTAAAVDLALVTINAQLFELPVNPDGFSPGGRGDVYFGTQDCSGSLVGGFYLTAPMPTLTKHLSDIFVMGDGKTLLYVNANPGRVFSGSYTSATNLDASGNIIDPSACQCIAPMGTCPNGNTPIGVGHEAGFSTFDLSTLGFVPPFTVQ